MAGAVHMVAEPAGRNFHLGYIAQACLEADLLFLWYGFDIEARCVLEVPGRWDAEVVLVWPPVVLRGGVVGGAVGGVGTMATGSYLRNLVGRHVIYLPDADSTIVLVYCGEIRRWFADELDTSPEGYLGVDAITMAQMWVESGGGLGLLPCGAKACAVDVDDGSGDGFFDQSYKNTGGFGS